MIKLLEDINNSPVIENVYGFKNFHGTKLSVLRKMAKEIAKEKRYEFFIKHIKVMKK